MLTVLALGVWIVLSLRRERRQDARGHADRNGYPLDVDSFPAVSPERVVDRPARWTCSICSSSRSARSSSCSSTALVVFFTLKYRRRHPDDVGADIHGSLSLELTWTFIPFVLSMVMFGWGASVFFRLARPPANAMDIFVVGKQWMWKVQHPEGVREINELHVPIGRPIRLTLGSEDVIHDFFIPAFRVKMDVGPRQADDDVVRGDAARDVPHLLRRSTAARSTRA